MVQVILTAEQLQRVQQHGEAVQLCDPQGNVLCIVDPSLTREHVAELKRRAASPGPRYTGQQVQGRLQALQEEWNRTGGFDENHMREFLGRLNAADPGHTRPQGLI